jgi:hypothetical protein
MGNAIIKNQEVWTLSHLEKIEGHVFRTRRSDNIRPGWNSFNIELVGSQKSLRREIMAEGKVELKGMRGRRKDAPTPLIVAALLEASQHWYFEDDGPALSMERAARWAVATMAWADLEFGRAVAAAVLHTDELAPHIHLMILPSACGSRRLVGRWGGGCNTFTRWTEDYGRAMKPLGLEVMDALGPAWSIGKDEMSAERDGFYGRVQLALGTRGPIRPIPSRGDRQDPVTGGGSDGGEGGEGGAGGCGQGPVADAGAGRQEGEGGAGEGRPRLVTDVRADGDEGEGGAGGGGEEPAEDLVEAMAAEAEAKWRREAAKLEDLDELVEAIKMQHKIQLSRKVNWTGRGGGGHGPTPAGGGRGRGQRPAPERCGGKGGGSGDLNRTGGGRRRGRKPEPEDGGWRAGDWDGNDPWTLHPLGYLIGALGAVLTWTSPGRRWRARLQSGLAIGGAWRRDLWRMPGRRLGGRGVLALAGRLLGRKGAGLSQIVRDLAGRYTPEALDGLLRWERRLETGVRAGTAGTGEAGVAERAQWAEWEESPESEELAEWAESPEGAESRESPEPAKRAPSPPGPKRPAGSGSARRRMRLAPTARSGGTGPGLRAEDGGGRRGRRALAEGDPRAPPAPQTGRGGAAAASSGR